MHVDDLALFFSVCKVEWETTVHDGPVTMMVRSPFMPRVLLTVGGYREEEDEGPVSASDSVRGWNIEKKMVKRSYHAQIVVNSAVLLR